ncbi:MAG: pilus assembly protein [Gammaproteobacteria bacterium]|nr:pilus assembly protein [Gammaproteobacteria bacterium]
MSRHLADKRLPVLHRSQPILLRRYNQWGTQTVEFAITVSVFLLIVFATFEGSRLLYSFTVTGHLAREAVRYAEVRGSLMAQDSYRSSPRDHMATQDTIKDFVTNRGLLKRPPVTAYACWGNNPVPCSNLAATCPDSFGNNQPDSPVFVTVAYQFKSALPSIINFLPTNLCSTARGTIVY